MGFQYFWKISSRAGQRRAAQQAQPDASCCPDEDPGNHRADHQRRLFRADLHFNLSGIGGFFPKKREGRRFFWIEFESGNLAMFDYRTVLAWNLQSALVKIAHFFVAVSGKAWYNRQKRKGW